jgi:hypothetical protein
MPFEGTFAVVISYQRLDRFLQLREIDVLQVLAQFFVRLSRFFCDWHVAILARRR